MSCETDISNLGFTGDVTDEADNCDPAIGQAVYADSLVINAPCSGSSILYRTWSLSDACGNSIDQIQVITLIDTLAPEFTIPADLTISCETDIDDLTLTGDVTDESDSCSPILGEATYRDSIDVITGCSGSRTIYRIWELVDPCGNINQQIQFITEIDTTPPIFTVPADISLSCDTDVSDLTITGDVLDESDNCDQALGEASYQDSLVSNQPCSGSFVLYRTWTLVDACNNSLSQLQTITLTDTTAPILQCLLMLPLIVIRILII